MVYNYLFDFRVEGNNIITDELNQRILNENISIFKLATTRWEQFRDSLRFYKKGDGLFSFIELLQEYEDDSLEVLKSLKLNEGIINDKNEDIEVTFGSFTVSIRAGDKVYFSNNSFGPEDFRRYSFIPEIIQRGYKLTHKNGIVSFDLDNLVDQDFYTIDYTGRSGGARWFFEVSPSIGTQQAIIQDITTIKGKSRIDNQSPVIDTDLTFMDTFQIEIVNKNNNEEIIVDYTYNINKIENTNTYSLNIVFPNQSVATYIRNFGRILIY